MPSSDPSAGIFAGLALAVDWYDNSLQAILATEGLKVVSRSQAMMMIHIVKGINRPSDIARAMRITRQNIHAMAKGLMDSNILELLPDPGDARSKQYVLSDEAKELREKVLQILAYLNDRLADRIGKDTVKDMRRALSADWGDVITEEPAILG